MSHTLVTSAASLCLMAACMTACTSSLPSPYLPCVSDEQCPGGRCADGLCVSLMDTQQDAKVEDGRALDSAPASCGEAGDCPAPKGGCIVAVCDDGTCSVAPLPGSPSCTTAGVCPAPGVCGGGACVAVGAPCDDGNPCTADQCTGEGCNHVTFQDGTPCVTDGLACTEERCEAGSCVAKTSAGWCLIAGVCHEEGAKAAGAPCLVCRADTSQSEWQTATQGACDDGDPCTTATECTTGGSCVGEPANCDDDNPCTKDSCTAGEGCAHLPNDATCTDADPCTEGGSCAGGVCTFAATLDCDDGNPCTKDSCTAGLGCVQAPQEATCVADTDPCTDDLCVAGNCVAVASASVCKIAGTCVPAGGQASGNPCLVCAPSQNPKGWTSLDSVACDDGNACTVLDGCAKGLCVGQPTTCQDTSPCTADACDPAKGCVFNPLKGACDDGDACTTGDVCVAGACKGAKVTVLDCDDGNPCTIDSCLSAKGCSHAPHNEPCDDNDPCTKYDYCTMGKCVAGKIVCPCEFNSDCDDGNPCTVDACVEGVGCENKPTNSGKPCVDADACTQQDVCVAGLCKGSKISCDDGSPCTEDACASDAGCVSKPVQGKGCDDGDACTTGDVCLDGKCAGTPKVCDDGKPCTADSCDAGACKHTVAADGTPCVDDGVPCTLDRCVKGACDHSTLKGSFCLIAGACLSGGALHPSKTCFGCAPLVDPKGWSPLVGQPCDDGNICTQVALCQANGACLGTPISCDDTNPCTLDACDPKATAGKPCKHVPASGKCSDGNDCTQGDVCKGEVCSGKPITCNDGDPCTDDGCQASGGCTVQPAVDGKACGSDGLPCTLDVCAQGSCNHLPKKGWCAISGDCVLSGVTQKGKNCYGCQPTVDANEWTSLTGASCDDGKPCTGDDTCAAGVCKGDPKKACDDGNPCTKDSCSIQTGCSHSPVAGPCDDGDPCTKADQCVQGICAPGQPVVCTTSAKEDAACQLSVCLPQKGGCTAVSTCGPLHACVDGLCLTQPPGKPPGPVTVPLPAGVASQPLRPSAAWQPSFDGTMGQVPQLWIAVQTSGCAPDLGVYAKLLAIRWAAAATTPEVLTLATPPPTGSGGWCAGQPVLRPHPTAVDALVLGWTEGGNAKSACPWNDHGGRQRVALLGEKGGGLAMSAGAACPSAGALAPAPWRPGMIVYSAQGSIGQGGQLSGVLLRGMQSGGAVAYVGDVVGAWGGTKGAALPSAGVTGWTEVPTKARPSVSPDGAGHVAWLPTRLSDGNGLVVPALTALRISPTKGPAKTRQVVLIGAPVAGVATYDAVEVAADPASKRVGVLIGGRAVASGATTAFLAFARVHPDQGAGAAPKAISLVKLGVNEPPPQAFRIARLPNSDRFLVVYAAPGSSVLKAMRIEPKDDVDFTVTDLGALANDFVAHPIAGAVDSSGGLSELAVDPGGTRYSLVYEGVGALQLLTTAMPSPK